MSDPRNRILSFEEKGALHQKLLENIRTNLSDIERVYAKITGHWYEVDMVYRYYHGSFKVYYTQGYTKEMYELLALLHPEPEFGLNRSFEAIIKNGTGREFELSHNQNWNENTLPQLMAFWHCKYFLEQALDAGHKMATAPKMLPSGWAALLTLYRIR